MKRSLVTAVVALIGLFAFQSPLYSSDQHEGEGVVKKIKVSDKKITITHGPIKSLGMDGMTMDFAVYDPAMLDEVQEGHNISFVLEKDKSGNLVVMELEDKGMAEGGTAADGDHSHQHNH
jgi:Cu/Ag efflux protein CusF